MTVGELIEKLQKYNKTDQILIGDAVLYNIKSLKESQVTTSKDAFGTYYNEIYYPEKHNEDKSGLLSKVVKINI